LHRTTDHVEILASSEMSKLQTPGKPSA
jgi:hypothetical protein